MCKVATDNCFQSLAVEYSADHNTCLEIVQMSEFQDVYDTQRITTVLITNCYIPVLILSPKRN
jgi:hypothetical protein